MRPLGIAARIFVIKSSAMSAMSAVRVAPGATQFALTLRVPISSASQRVKGTIVALVATQ
jgi:hypothetical protein